MLRKSVRVSGRLALSAAISWTLIPIAVADAPMPQAAPSTSEASTAPAAKPLYTVPEDGMGDTHWLSGATQFVREMLAKRPKEDLVICIAGCVPKQDRVVYAQPAIVADPAANVSDANTKSEFVPSMALPSASEGPAN